MVEAIYVPNNGPHEQNHQNYNDGVMSQGIADNVNAVGAPNRNWMVQKEKNKLPISLCRKPNKLNMKEDEYIDSIREMLANRIYLDEEERQAFGLVVKQGVPQCLRAQFWNLCTGNQMYRHGYCNDYYKTLHAALDSGQLERYPNQMFEKFRRDIERSFPNDNYYTAEIKESISRILEAYIWRNPTVGYIQGFNFLVFRLRKVLNEEDTFWTLAIIIETYMPPDYYVEMYGVRTQATILQKIFRQYSFLPEVQAKFEDPAIQFNLMDNAISWFISLYTECLPEQASLEVLDMFFLFGQTNNKVIFDVALGYLKTLQVQIVGATDLGSLKNDVFTEENKNLQDTKVLMQEIHASSLALKQEHIDFYRPVCQKEAVDGAHEIKKSAYNRFKKVRDNYKEDQTNNVEKIRKQFLEMFSLFSGDIRDRMKNSYRDPIAQFKCDQKWPMCAFNFSKKHVIPDTFTFKSGDYDDILIYPNYFSPIAIEMQPEKEEGPSTLANIVIERNYHYCRANMFINTFASLYVNKRKQSRLFRCKQLAIKKNMTQIESHRKMMKFVAFIKEQKLSDRERVRMDIVRVIMDPSTIKYHDTVRGDEHQIQAQKNSQNWDPDSSETTQMQKIERQTGKATLAPRDKEALMELDTSSEESD